MAPSTDQLTEDVERGLLTAVDGVEASVADAVSRLDYGAALEGMLSLSGPVAAFFDGVLVEAPDPAIKAVRMGLLLRISRMFLQVADFSQIHTR